MQNTPMSPPQSTRSWVESLTEKVGPVLTWYLPDRIEFSGPVWARWLAKIDNFLVTEFPFGADIAVLDLPNGWQRLAWHFTLLNRGWQVEDADGLAEAELVISNDDALLSEAAATGVPTLAQPTDPLGLRWFGDLPAGAVDGAAELMGQPDALLEDSAPGTAELTASDLLGDLVDAGPQRVLLEVSNPDLLTAAVAQLWNAGHSVVIGAPETAVDQERITARISI